eukprot:994953-Prorocentrum_minimum.AAC.1
MGQLVISARELAVPPGHLFTLRGQTWVLQGHHIVQRHMTLKRVGSDGDAFRVEVVIRGSAPLQGQVHLRRHSGGAVVEAGLQLCAGGAGARRVRAVELLEQCAHGDYGGVGAGGHVGHALQQHRLHAPAAVRRLRVWGGG